MPSSADPNEWSIANNIYQDPFHEPLIQGSKSLLDWEDFKITLFFTERARVYIVAIKCRHDSEPKVYLLKIPKDWPEYIFSVDGFTIKLWYDENDELQTEAGFSFVDEEFDIYEEVEIDPDAKKESKPAKLPWQPEPDKLTETSIDDVMALIDETLAEV